MTGPLPPGARDNDPPTSHRAAGGNGDGRDGRRRSIRYRLLVAYHENPEGLTDEEAAMAAGIDPRSGVCYWKRSSELREIDCIAPLRDRRGTLVTRQSTLGAQREVCAITDTGIAAISNPDLVKGAGMQRSPLVDRQIRQCSSMEELRDLWRFYKRNGTLTPSVQRKLMKRSTKLAGGT